MLNQTNKPRSFSENFVKPLQNIPESQNFFREDLDRKYSGNVNYDSSEAWAKTFDLGASLLLCQVLENEMSLFMLSQTKLAPSAYTFAQLQTDDGFPASMMGRLQVKAPIIYDLQIVEVDL